MQRSQSNKMVLVQQGRHVDRRVPRKPVQAHPHIHMHILYNGMVNTRETNTITYKTIYEALGIRYARSPRILLANYTSFVPINTKTPFGCPRRSNLADFYTRLRNTRTIYGIYGGVLTHLRLRHITRAWEGVPRYPFRNRLYLTCHYGLSQSP